MRRLRWPAHTHTRAHTPLNARVVLSQCRQTTATMASGVRGIQFILHTDMLETTVVKVRSTVEPAAGRRVSLYCVPSNALTRHPHPLPRACTHTCAQLADVVQVVGSTPELGNWRIEDAPTLKFEMGSRSFRLTVRFDKGTCTHSHTQARARARI